MSDLHAWHREVFTKRTDVELVFPAQATEFAGTLPEQRRQVTLNSARAVVCQRIVNAMTPAQRADAFASTGETDPELAELALLKVLFESDHPELVLPGELALLKVLDHHAAPAKLAAIAAEVLSLGQVLP